MLRRLVLTLGLIALAAAPAAAQVPVLDIRLGAHAVVPTGDLGDVAETGFGVYGRIGAPVGPIKLMGSVTWNRLTAKAGFGSDQDVLTFQAGPHFSLAMLDVGIEGGYFSEVEEFGLTPNVSIGLLGFELTASYNTTLKDPATNWLSIGAGFRF